MWRQERDQLLETAGADAVDFTAGSVRTCALVAGSGSSLLLLHGLNPAGAIIWWPVLAELSRRFRVVAPDLPGFGQSDPLPGKLTAEEVSRWLTSVVRHLGVGPVAVAGTSLGSVFALRFALRQAQLVSRLVLIDALGLAPFRPPLGYLVGTLRSSLRPTATALDRLVPYVIHDEQHVDRFHAERWASFRRCYLAGARQPLVRRTMRQAASGANARPIPPRLLAGIEHPVHLIWGRHDRPFPLQVAERAHARFGWPLEIVEDAGHLPYLEQPRPFVEALLRGLDSNDAGSRAGSA